MTLLQKWTLHDLSEVMEDYTFAINPNVMDGPALVVELELHGQAVDGSVRAFGKTPPRDWSFSGVLHDQAQYEVLRDWVAMAGKTHLTDHMDRKWLVRLKNFQPTRAGSRKHPWRHTYEVQVTTYGGPL